MLKNKGNGRNNIIIQIKIMMGSVCNEKNCYINNVILTKDNNQ